jgi:hypothetical protein
VKSRKNVKGQLVSPAYPLRKRRSIERTDERMVRKKN